MEALSYRTDRAPSTTDGINYLLPIDNKWVAIITLNYEPNNENVDPNVVLYDRITITIQSTDATSKVLLGPVTHRKVAR